MNKMIEPAVEPTMTKEDASYMVARAREGLADIEAGRKMSVEEARVKMEAHIAKSEAPKSQGEVKPGLISIDP